MNIKYEWAAHETCHFVICCACSQLSLTWCYLHVEVWPCHDVTALEEKTCEGPTPLQCSRILLHDHSTPNHSLLSHEDWNSKNKKMFHGLSSGRRLVSHHQAAAVADDYDNVDDNDRECKLPWNISQYLPDYMVWHPRRLILTAVRTSNFT